MGIYHTLLGHIVVQPPLNSVERCVVAAASPMGGARPGPDEQHFWPDPPAGTALLTGAGGRRSPWRPTPCGSALYWDELEKPPQPAWWLKHLIGTVLGPDATARNSPELSRFTFDHVLDGVVAIARRDTADVGLIVVVENQVSEVTVLPGVDEWELNMSDFLDHEGMDAQRVARFRRGEWVAQLATAMGLSDSAVPAGWARRVV